MATTNRGEAEPAVALALFRTSRLGEDRAAVFASVHAIPSSQARLAVALAEGASIAEAASPLGTTLETPRYYSKRLYDAMGTRRQGDLVRMFWTEIA